MNPRLTNRRKEELAKRAIAPSLSTNDECLSPRFGGSGSLSPTILGFRFAGSRQSFHRLVQSLPKQTPARVLRFSRNA